MLVSKLGFLFKTFNENQEEDVFTLVKTYDCALLCHHWYDACQGSLQAVSQTFVFLWPDAMDILVSYQMGELIHLYNLGGYCSVDL